MAGWAGFTDEDLKQIQQTTSPGPPSGQSLASRQQAMAKKQKLQQQQQQRELARQRAKDFATGNNNPLPSSQRLSQPSPEKTMPGPKASPESDSTTATERTVSEGGKAMAGGEAGDEQTKTEAKEDVKELDEQEALGVEMSRVDKFRQQQQKIEEENKHRRKMLAAAINQRSKMAKEEAEKLTKVQKELNRLDSLVNADVSIIRDRIEAASIDFLQAQKRYERAEREFVEAKMALAEKSDAKESLTEHLYTVIQQNEARKAKRLAQLMKQLGLEGEDYSTALNDVPPLLSFSPINTLHRPHLPPAPTSPQADLSSQGGGGSSGVSVEKSCDGLSRGKVEHEASEQNGVQSTADAGKNDDSVVLKSESSPESVGDEKKDLGGGSENGSKILETGKEKEVSQAENNSPESQDGGG
ncbi:RAB6-interacting golgin-like [Littorina saxatilis]|uniref:RAB6-interacting golgin n=1 Tax=Littorina saxatilis TaxID=31220 RepID=A0AAN9BY29_9CAEN